MNSTVRSAYFSPSFENKHNPDLIINGPTQKWLIGVLEDGYIVVDDHPLKNSLIFYSELINSIDAGLFLVIEDIVNLLGLQSKRY